jgi:hypothetical protein
LRPVATARFEPLPDPLGAYLPRERVALPDEMLPGGAAAGLKLQAIACYPSQTGPDVTASYLGGFARAEEAFFPEALERDPCRPHGLRRTPVPGTTALRWRFTVAGRCETGMVRVVLEEGSGTQRGLEVSLAGTPSHLRVRRTDAPEAEGPLLDAALPQDAQDTAHVYDLLLDPRPDDGPFTEITLQRDDQVLAAGIDAREALTIGRQSVDAPTGCTVTPPEADRCATGRAGP